jgi:hypothetical protein
MNLLAAAKQRLARRSPEPNDEALQRRWRESNRERLLDAAPALTEAHERLAHELTENGIVSADFSDVFGSRELYDEAAREARRMYDAHRASPPSHEGDSKPFLTQLFKGPIRTDDVWGRIALDPGALAVANAYLGMHSMLRAVQVWLTEPTPGPAVETQLWHRDGDDVMNVKLFVYFTQVGGGSGPFTYAPKTHPVGSTRQLPEHVNTRSTDDQMAAVVPKEHWRVCTGEPGTIVFADTCGYHKQLKPETDERLLLMIQYTSGTPAYPRTLEIGGGIAALDEAQQLAVRD